MENPKAVLRYMALVFVLGVCYSGIARAVKRLVGLQSAPSVAMALPWFAEEARLYSK